MFAYAFPSSLAPSPLAGSIGVTNTMARLFLAATLLLALASAPARAVVIGEFLTEPKYAPFLKKVRRTCTQAARAV